MKRLVPLLVCLLLFSGTAQGESYRPIPACLRFNMTPGEKKPLSDTAYIRRSYVKTSQKAVDQEINGLMDAFTADKSLLPGTCKKMGYQDVTCRVSRSGQSAMSFLILSSTVKDMEQVQAAFESRVYDMQTGDPIRLPALFRESEEVWSLLGREIRRQINACYPHLTADSQTIDALCQADNIKDAAFSLTGAQLELHYSAKEIYGRPTVMHVRIPYRTLQPYFSAYGKMQTDNSAYKMIALTYDDGPVRNTSHYLMDTLLCHGANATFFVVGTRLNTNKDILCREQDTGFQVASHNYEHVYKETNLDKIRRWKTRFDTELSQITGTLPTAMRAPGGNYKNYARAPVNLPLIQWSVVSDDASANHSEAQYRRIVGTVCNRAVPGAIVLMHDMNYQCPQYSEEILTHLEQNNFLCVTVDELFLHYGIELQPNQVYYDAMTPAETVK